MRPGVVMAMAFLLGVSAPAIYAVTWLLFRALEIDVRVPGTACTLACAGLSLIGVTLALTLAAADATARTEEDDS